MKFRFTILLLIYFILGNAQTIRPSVNSLIIPAMKSTIEARNLHKYSGTKFIYTGLQNGLHCNWLEDGSEIWSFTLGESQTDRGKTPAVDQENKLVYFQQNNRLFKLDAVTGQQLDYAAIPSSLGGQLVASGNTVLVNDTNGYYIISHYQRWLPYGSTLFCHDADLDLVWSVDSLNSTAKNTITYHGGLVYFGTGETFAQGQEEWYIDSLEDCRVNAYNIADGSLEWSTLLSDPEKIYEPMGYGVMNTIYCNGYLIVEQTIAGGAASGDPAKIHVLNATTGAILKTYVHGDGLSSCGTVSLSNGYFVTGDLVLDKMLVFKIGEGATTDFHPFGAAQTNTMEAPDEAMESLADSITCVDTIAGGDQGSTIINGVCYAAFGTNSQGVVAFDIETLETIRQLATANSYDSSPMVVQNRAGKYYMLVHENENLRTICRDVSDGSLIWYSPANQPGNLFFGFSYYEYP